MAGVFLYLPFPYKKKLWPFYTHITTHSFTSRKFFFLNFFFYELIKDQSIEKKLYYYSVGVCVCAWLCVFSFGVRACECSSVSFFFLNYFPTSKIFFWRGACDLYGIKNHITFFCCPKPVCLFSCCSTSPNGILSFWQIFDCLKLDSGLVVFLYWARENDVF